HRHIWQDYLDEVEHLRHTSINKQIYEKRKETIERVFADMKEKHGMRWTTLRTKRRVQMQAMLVFAAMNLKKLANWCWRGGNPYRFFTSFRLIYLKTPSVILSQRAFVFNLRRRVILLVSFHVQDPMFISHLLWFQNLFLSISLKFHKIS